MLRGARAEDSALADERANGLTPARAQALPLTIVIEAAKNRYLEFAGTWHASIASPIAVTLTIDGTAVAGTVRIVTPTGASSLEVFDGRIDGRAIAFKVASPDGIGPSRLPER